MSKERRIILKVRKEMPVVVIRSQSMNKDDILISGAALFLGQSMKMMPDAELQTLYCYKRTKKG